VARGDDDDGSDVDLLVDFAREHSPAEELLAVLGLSEDLSNALAMRVRVASPATLREEVRERADAEAIAL
jgi:predicted nucleotidyltransferase